jgi:2-amino-4-hydroxy-6-hydroxymethyldihydropteridine diphosphokinase
MTIHRGARVYLALGSNLGDRARHLLVGGRGLALRGVRIVGASAVYATGYVGPPPDQPEYLNAVVEGITTLSPMALLAVAREVEALAGRLPATHGQPRPLDVDILFYDDVQVSGPDLVLPHPRIRDRLFVLEPLHDLGALDARPQLAAARAELVGRQALRRVGAFQLGEMLAVQQD